MCVEQCKIQPEPPLYNGGMLKDQQHTIPDPGDRQKSLSFSLKKLDAATKYCFSSWVSYFSLIFHFISAHILSCRICYVGLQIKCLRVWNVIDRITVWIRTKDAESAMITASLVTQDSSLKCIGTVTAYKGCWSFLKGGFVLSSPSNSSTLYIKVTY